MSVSHPPSRGLQGVRRRIVYVTLCELFAVMFTSLGLAFGSGAGLAQAGVAGVFSSAVAVAWNVVFNHLFERWEARQPVRGRNLKRRIAHALGFEGGLVVMLVPAFAWWLDISLWQAFVLDFGLLLFFLVYTYVFNWAFDRVFGLPLSAQPRPEALTSP
jgi:uncharacterized membrane protein